MRQHYSRGVMTLLITGAILTGSITAMAANSPFKMAGLALHQETGREIYIGGLYFDQHVPIPDDLVGASGPKLMEYRVVARRTSIRSLLGGMLLQSEVATGQAPDNATTEFAQHILSTVKSSLYAGDSFEILLSEDDQTIAYLNGHKLAQADDGTIADYLLMGWVGEHGPSTVFRKSILSKEVDSALFAAFQANTYTSERELKVASWIGEQDPTTPDMTTEPTAGDATTVATLVPEMPDTVQNDTTPGPHTEPTSEVTQNDTAAAATAAILRLPELKQEELEAIDPVAIAEFSNGQDNALVIPVPVQFMLTE